MENRRGPLSKKDKEYIAEHYDNQTSDEIARVLQRNPLTITEYIEENHSSHFQERAKSAEYNIQSSPIWKDLELQFSERELEMFLFHWGRIVSQFRDDVYPTEQMQVIDTVKLEILMNRALTQQQECMNDISRLESLLQEEKSVSREEQDRQEIQNLERQVGFLRAAQESLSDNYRDLLNKKNSILKEMKATRDARIKSIESSKHSFPAWMRRMLDDVEMRERLGIQMEKQRLAMTAEFERLSEYHTYADGMLDQPILNEESVRES